MELKEIIKYVKESAEQDLVNVDSNMVLDCATRIFISENISKDKKQNIQQMKGNVFDGKPTKKQIWALQQMQVKNIESLSFDEASKLIKEYREKNPKEY